MATRAIPAETTTSAGPNPALKSLVYSKYRELLGSYNGKANEILQSYPAYLVKEDKGFDFVDNYGGPPQSTIGSSARRIQAQLPAEPPACVQNAMMRRDKQPFTYTPGGIDLSQIKSPRMAKRISRNAQSEGVSNQPKVSPLAQNNSSSSNGSSQPAVSPAATLGAAAMGMPFQVFPTGPPAPPPPPPPNMAKRPAPVHSTQNGNSVTAPPPPPPPVLPPASKVSPKPQSFEPPPMGCRPEIKIPPNPMANLRKAPRPQPKNDFWIEEYRNEKRNEMPDRPSLQMPMPSPQPQPVQYSSRDADDEVAKNTQNRTHELTVRDQSPKKRSPSPSNLTKPLENGSRVSSIKTPPVYSQSPVPASLPPPITPTKVSQTPPDTSTKSSTVTLQQDQSSKPRQNSPSPPKTSAPSSNGSPTTPNTPSTTNNNNNSNRTSPVKPPTAQKPAPQPLGSLYIPPVHEVFAHSKQTLLNQTSPPWMSSRQNSAKEQPEWVHKDDPEALGSSKSSQVSKSNESTTKPSEPIAAAPPSPAKPSAPVPQQKPQPQQQQQQQPSPPPQPPTTPAVSRPQPVEAPPTPQYQQPQPTISQTHYIQLQNPAANRQPQLQQQQPAMPANRSYPQTPVYAQNQVYTPQPASSQKERIIPIQMEQSPIKAPVSAPAFAPPPYYSPGPQYNNVQSPLTVGYPHSGFTTPTAMFTNPNHFVNQGYNNITYPPTSPQIYQQHHYQQAPSTPQQQPQQHVHMMHQQQRMQQQTPTQQQSGGVRIIPIKVEGGEAAATNVRGPLSQTPAIIQSDPRSSNNPQVCNGSSGAPNQSRSFRVLQQITDTMEDADQLKPTTPKPSGDQSEGAEGQLRRMQLSNDDKALMNRVKSQVDGEVFLHNEEDPRYRGAAIPSKAFRYLQNMTDGGGTAAASGSGGSQPANSSNTGSTNRTNQMFVRNPGNSSESEDASAAQQQYVSPSEQRVEEPKKYTGSAIPSRSFKMLQAMTQSDAPADSNSSDLEGNQNLPCNGDIRYSPYPYPMQPHYCCNPNWHYYDPNNPQYYPPHHPPPPPHHAPGYYYPQPPPPPPPPPHGHYDRGAAYYAGYMSPHHFYYPQEPCSPCTPPPYYQLSQQPQVAYCENVVPDSPTHTYVITTPPPRIVVTPTPEDSDAESILNEFNSIAHPLTRSQSSLKRLSERLADFSTSPEKLFAADTDQKVRCSPISSPLNERYRTYEESTSSAPSSQSECSDSEEEANKKQDQAAASPKITPQNGTKPQNGHSDNEDDDESSESEDEETVGYDNNPPEHLPHQLSVIFEEESNYSCSANPSRRASVCSNSSTLSDCSSTLANDLDDDDDDDGQNQAVKNGQGNQTDDDIDHLDDEESQESQVSVKPVAEANNGHNDEEDETDEESTEEEEETDEEPEQNNAQKQTANNHDSGSSEEEECSETEESESEAEQDKKPVIKPIVETVENGDSTDVTVTITIPSMSNKSINEGSDSKPKQSEDSKPNFTVDYEEDSHVSVSVSLPLKLKPSESAKPPTEVIEKPKENDSPDGGSQQENDDEEIDFWSQIGEEDEMSRPRSSYSREFWSSREVSIDRDAGWTEEEANDGDIDFWNNENGPTEALDLWKADPAIGSFLDRQKNEISSDSIHFWHSENERMVSDLYSKRNQGEVLRNDARAMDENNNANGWNKIDQSSNVDADKERKANANDDGKVEVNITTKQSDDEAETDDSSDEESEDDSEEYETTNTSKEESEAEENEPQQVEQSRAPAAEEQRMPEIVLKKVTATEKVDHKCNEILSVINTITKEDDKTLSVRDRISIFEQSASSPVPSKQTKTNESNHHLRPPSGMKLSCDESEAEDDSGVTSDMSKHISEVETDSECFPEMRKMTRYQRAATHSRLFKLLQDESNNGDSEDEDGANAITSEECNNTTTMPNGRAYQNGSESPRPTEMSKYKGSSSYEDNSSSIVPNTATDRRDRLSLPIRHLSSSGIESLSSSTSSASPVSGVTNEKLAEELVQSLLMKKKGRLFRNLPLEKLHAAALKILQEDLESNDTISSTEDNIMTVDSTPALTPQEFKSECPNSYSEYYDTWSELNGKASPHPPHDGQSQSEATTASRHSRKAVNGWSPRCPRVLSSKSISRLAEVRETETPEPTSTISRSRPPSRASNQSPFLAMSAGLIEDHHLAGSGSRSSYKHFKLNNL